jgi:hypothetical protein
MMTNKNIFIFLVFFSMSFTLTAQEKSKNAAKTARTDVRKYFKLSDEKMKVFRKNRGNSTSDFFKPSQESVSDPALLQDSVYVKAYRESAYNNTTLRKTAGHYFLLTGIGFVGAAAVVAIAL